VLDPAQSELDDASVQRQASPLRLGLVWRKNFQLQPARVRDQPAQLQLDFDVVRWGSVIVVEQVEDQSPTVWFPSQLA